MEDASQCMLVVIGATKHGTKELVAIRDGYRESEQSWLDLLNDLKLRGLTISPKIAEIKVGLQMAHEVVIHKCENGILYLKDPSFGRYYAMKVEDFAQFWNGRAMIYNPKKGP
jgi:hypothetical protein